MTTYWLCASHLTPPRFIACHDHGEGDSGAEKHTRSSGHPTWTLDDPDWLARLLANHEEAPSTRGASSASEEDT